MIIPMIDIVFFLLVFFMMSTLYMNTEEQIPLNLPKASASTAKTIEPITISLTATHKMYLNEREIRPDDLGNEIQGIVAKEPQQAFIVRASEDIVLLDARQRNWSDNLISELGLPRQLFGEIVFPGTVRGKLKQEIADETGLGCINVVAVGSHDTASAVFAVPSNEPNRAYLSSGTWSLLGAEVDQPILTEEARVAGFTNEGGIQGKIRFLQNITGLWILQRLMAEWKEQGKEISYDCAIAEATVSDIRSVIDVDDSAFCNPDHMEESIIKYCHKHHLRTPVSQGEFVRCVIESLAYRYKLGVEQMNRCLPAPVKQLHIIGGGCQNRLLNQLTANALGIPVYAGPVEATAIGNILVQAKAQGEVDSWEELKEIIINSVEPQVYYPE